LEPKPARFAVLLCAVLLAAAAVSVVGMAGFVGLIAPLLASALVGRDPRLLVPVAALIGAVALSGADALAQGVTLLVPEGPQAQRLGLPAGSVTSIAGAILLIAAVRRRGLLNTGARPDRQPKAPGPGTTPPRTPRPAPRRPRCTPRASASATTPGTRCCAACTWRCGRARRSPWSGGTGAARAPCSGCSPER